MRDMSTGAVLLTSTEAAEAERDAEHAARKVAEARAASLEDELQKLRAQLNSE